MDIVERFGEVPFVFRVVDLESKVWGDVQRLDGGEVCAKDVGIWMLFRWG
jgi:hypothetical protein